jgi:hypothetical protein
MDMHREDQEKCPEDPAIDELERAERLEHWIVANGRRKEVYGKRISFEEAVKLAFPKASHAPCGSVGEGRPDWRTGCWTDCCRNARR